MPVPKSTRARALLLLALGLGLGACAHTVPVTGSHDFPLIEGKLKVGGALGGSRVDVELHGLVPPGQAQSGATVFMVWLRDQNPKAGDAPQKLGALTVTTEGRDMVGRLSGKTTLSEFDYFVTAETSADVAAPIGKLILTGIYPSL